MIIRDEIYGMEIIKEPVLIELIKSRPIQRLKKISQFGLPDKYYFLKGYSRFKHSVGVLILLRRLGANIVEQIAGLLHDVSHLAFSHVADYVFGYGRNEDMHDTLHEDFISKSKISVILKKYDISAKRISTLKNFNLLESDSPHLCADRIDYCLREFFRFASNRKRDFIIDSLIVCDHEIIFNNYKAALIFADVFLQLQDKHWAGFEAKVRYHLMSELLKKALKKKIIQKEDFYRYDNFIIDKLLKSGNKELINKLNTLKAKKLDLKKYNFTINKKKLRYADPRFIKKTYTLSRVDKKFAQKIKDYRNNFYT